MKESILLFYNKKAKIVAFELSKLTADNVHFCNSLRPKLAIDIYENGGFKPT